MPRIKRSLSATSEFLLLVWIVPRTMRCEKSLCSESTRALRCFTQATQTVFESVQHYYYFESLWNVCKYVPLHCFAGLGLWGWGFWAYPEGSHWLSAGHLLWSDWKAAGLLLCGHDHQTLGLPGLWVHQDHARYIFPAFTTTLLPLLKSTAGRTSLNGLWPTMYCSHLQYRLKAYWDPY